MCCWREAPGARSGLPPYLGLDRLCAGGDKAPDAEVELCSDGPEHTRRRLDGVLTVRERMQCRSHCASSA
jgi:hypothetical protein